MRTQRRPLNLNEGKKLSREVNACHGIYEEVLKPDADIDRLTLLGNPRAF